MADIHENLIFTIKAQMDTAIDAFKKMDTMIAGIKDGAKQLSSTLNQVNKPMASSANATTKAWQNQIIQLNKANSTATTSGRNIINLEKQKQREIDKTTRLQQKQQQSAMNKIGNFILPGFGGGLGMMGAQAAIQGIQALKDAVGRGIEFNMMEESARMMYSVILKDGDKAVALMNDLRQASLETSLVYKDTMVSARQLLAYGFSDTQVVDTLRMLGDVSAATGKDVQDLAYVYGTLRTQGKAYARDLTQFAMRGIPIYEELAKQFDMTSDALLRLVKAGKIDIMFADVEKAFNSMTGAGGVFDGAGEAMLQTLSGQFKLLEERTDIIMGKLTSSMDSLIRLFIDGLNAGLNMLQGFSGFLEGAGKFGRDIGGWTVIEESVADIQEAMKMGGEAAAKAFDAFFSKNTVKSLVDREKYMARVSGRFANGGRTPGQVEQEMVMTANIAKRTGLDQLKLAEEMNKRGLILLETYNEILNSQRQSAILSASENPGDVEGTKGMFGRFMESMGVSIFKYLDKAIPRVERTAGYSNLAPQGQRRLASERVGQISAIASSDDFNKFVFNPARATWIELQKAELEQALSLANAVGDKNGVIAGKAQEAYADAIENAIGMISTLLMGDTELNSSAIAEYQKMLQYLLGELSTTNAGKPKATKADPGIWEDLRVTQTVTQFDDITREMEKRIAEINEAYKGVPNSSEKLRLAIQHTTASFDSLRHAQQNYEEAFSPEKQQELVRLQAGNVSGDDFTMTWQANFLQLQQELAQKELDHRKKIADLRETDDLNNAEKLYDLEVKLIQSKFDYEKKMAERARNIETANKAISGDSKFWEDMMANGGALLGQGKTLEGGLTTAVASSGLQGTDVGKLIAKADPLTMMLTSLMEMVLSIENVAKSLNFFGTIMESASKVVTYLFNHAFQPIVNLLEYFGTILGELLSPFIVLLDLVTTFAYLLSALLMPAIKVISTAFEWFSDYVLIPVANGFIDIVNGVIDFINGALSALGAELIPRLDRLLTSAERRAQEEEMAKSLNVLEEAVSYLKNKLKAEVDSAVSSLQRLYEVGAISADEYETQSKAQYALVNQFDDQYKLLMENLPAVLSASTPESMAAMLKTLIPQLELAREGKLETTLSQLNTTLQQLEATLGKKDTGSTTNTGNNTSGAGGTTKPTLTATQTAQIRTASTGVATLEHNVQFFKDYVGGMAFLTQDAKSTIYKQINDIGITGLIKSLKDAISKNDITSVLSLAQQLTAKGRDFNSWVNQWYGMLGVQGIPGFAVGTGNVPYDMVAQIHKGEMIVPKPYADEIRNGSGSGDVNVTVIVQGSVQAENDLAQCVAKAIYKSRKTGVLTV